MNIKEEIQYEIYPSGGSEKRIISRVCSRCNCTELEVRNCINWLEEKGYIKKTYNCNEMNDEEKRYFDSDSCAILQKIRKFDEIEYWEEERQRKEKEDSLSTNEKINLYFQKMQVAAQKEYFGKPLGYKLVFDKNFLIVEQPQCNNPVKIDIQHTSQWYYNEETHEVTFRLDDHYYTFQLYRDINIDRILVNVHNAY